MFKVGDFVKSKRSGIVYEIIDRAGRNPFNMKETLWEVENEYGLPNAFGTSELEYVQQCSANVGGDPVSGCEELAEGWSDYCAEHNRILENEAYAMMDEL